jgi:hypothetical protein
MAEQSFSDEWCAKALAAENAVLFDRLVQCFTVVDTDRDI